MKLTRFILSNSNTSDYNIIYIVYEIIKKKLKQISNKII